MYPEYTGVLLSAVAGKTQNPPSRAGGGREAKAFVEKHGLTLLDLTPFYDTNVLATLPRVREPNTNSRASATSSRSARA